MRIGIHVRGFDAGKPVAVARALERGAETIQIFASNPRQWRLPPVDPAADLELRRQMAVHDVAPLFLHAPYLVNLASPAIATFESSVATLEWTMRRGAELGAQGVVVHAGHTAGGERSAAIDQTVAAICNLLDKVPAGPRLLVELTAGARGAIASRITQAAELIEACGGHHRLGICLDTCHLFAAGYDLTDTCGLEELACDLEELGPKRLALLHTNDSRDPVGSGRDRHWHVGGGSIGVDGFRLVVRHPVFEGVPMVCETPGEAAEDRSNIDLLKALRDEHAGAGIAPAAASDSAVA